MSTTRDRRTASSETPRSDSPVTDPFDDLDDEDEDEDEEDDEEENGDPRLTTKHRCVCAGLEDEEDDEGEEQDGLSILGLADGLLNTLHTLGQYRGVTQALEASVVLDRLEQSLVARLNEVTGLVEKLKFGPAEEDPSNSSPVPSRG
jgi:hypothetical protein